MTHRLIRFGLALPVLVCLLGASSMSFNANQPFPNPNKVGQLLEGKGTYTVDPAETFVETTFYAQNTKTKQNSDIGTINAKGKDWEGLLQLAVGNYDAWGMITTKNKGGVYVYNYTTIVNVDVK